MIIGGLQKNSFIDYPGMISCVLFLRGCNFRCPYCHNPDLVREPFTDDHPVEDIKVFEMLENRRGLLDGVVITGGEPTLQKGLLSLCHKVKTLGYPIKLDTNGSRPDVLEDLLRHDVLDYVAMDVKTDPSHYEALTRAPLDPTLLFGSIRLIMSSGLPYEFRTTCVRPFVDEGIMATIGKSIEGAMRYALQTFRRAERLLDPGFSSEHEAGFTLEEMERLRAVAAPWVKECLLR